MSEPSDKPRRTRRKPVKDVALLAGPTEDGEGARVLRLREGTLSAGELRPLREGQDVRAQELVRLHALGEHPQAFEVEVVQAPTRDAAERPAGPARVSNRDYRRNWDRVFGARSPRASSDYTVN